MAIDNRYSIVCDDIWQLPVPPAVEEWQLGNLDNVKGIKYDRDRYSVFRVDSGASYLGRWAIIFKTPAGEQSLLKSFAKNVPHIFCAVPNFLGELRVSWTYNLNGISPFNCNIFYSVAFTKLVQRNILPDYISLGMNNPNKRDISTTLVAEVVPQGEDDPTSFSMGISLTSPVAFHAAVPVSPS